MSKSKLSMTSKERVLAAVTGKQVDRPPVFYWINAHAGCRLMAEYRPSKHMLRSRLATAFWNIYKNNKDRETKDLPRLLPLFYDIHSFNWANEYGVELGGDILLASFATPWKYSKFFRQDGRIRIKDVYGVTRGLGSGIYPDMFAPAAGSIEEVVNYKLPDPEDSKLYSMFRSLKKKYPNTAIAAEIWGPQDFTATSVVGMEKFMMALIDHPDEMKAFMRRWTDFHIEAARRCVDAGADIIMILDDYGYNNRPLMSMKMWREFTFPELKRLVAAVRDTGAIAALHSCGFQMPFLEHYVEAGIQVLQSLQPLAGNDLAEACKKVGNKISFITGIDTQGGEMMEPEDFRENILRNHRIMTASGTRHILGTTHEIQPTMTDANVDIMLKTVSEILSGKHD